MVWRRHIRRFVRRSLREGRSIRDPLRNRVTFAALCGVHCGQGADYAYDLEVSSHSPLYAAFIAGITPWRMIPTSQCHIRRSVRRSLRVIGINVLADVGQSHIRRFVRRSLRD